MDFPDNAYILSKFVCDNLIAEKIRSRIPWKFPYLYSESIDRGKTDLVGNHLVIRPWKDAPTPVPFTILPVSQASSIVSSIFLNDTAAYEMYNVANPLGNDGMEVPETINEDFRYSVEITQENEDFLEYVDNVSSDESSFEILDVIKKNTTWENFLIVLKNRLLL